LLPGGDYRGARPSPISRRQRAISTTTSSSVGPTAVHSGIAVQIHGIGDAAVRSALDILQALPRIAGGIRHRVEHGQLVHPVDIPRFGAAGIAASVQPVHLVGDAPVARMACCDRTRWSFPIRSLAAGGALIAFGTDAPVESPDPWPGIAMAVTRAWLHDRAIAPAGDRVTSVDG